MQKFQRSFALLVLVAGAAALPSVTLASSVHHETSLGGSPGSSTSLSDLLGYFDSSLLHQLQRLDSLLSPTTAATDGLNIEVNTGSLEFEVGQVALTFNLYDWKAHNHKPWRPDPDGEGLWHGGSGGNPVPVPASGLLLASGLGVMGMAMMYRRRSTAALGQATSSSFGGAADI